MRLIKTNSGNYAKEITITGGGKWRFVGVYLSERSALQAAATQEAKGRRVRIEREYVSRSKEKQFRDYPGFWAVCLATREPVYVGPTEDTPCFRVEAYIAAKKQVMTHATRAECLAVGVTPGPMNT